MFQDYTNQQTMIAVATTAFLIAGTYRMLMIDGTVTNVKLRLGLAVFFPFGWAWLLYAGYDEVCYRLKSL